MNRLAATLQAIFEAPDERGYAATSLDDHLRHRTVVLAKSVFLLIFVFGLLYWPLDEYLPFTREELALLDGYRQLTSVGTLVGFLLLRFSRIARRRPGLVLLVAACVFQIDGNIRLGGIQAPERPLLYDFYVSSFASLAYAGPLVPRAVGAGVLLLASVLSFVFGCPEILDAPMFQNFMAMYVFAGVCGVFAGHLAYLPTREAFLRKAELEAANAVLDERVRERTRELRQLAAHLSQLLESERTRIARELHDELAQTLATLRFEVELLDTPRGRPIDAESLARMDGLLATTLATTQRVLSGLRPRILGDGTVVQALMWLVDEFRRRNPDVACTLELGSDPPDIEAAQSTALFRIVQECLSNVGKYARAKQVRVRLASADATLSLEVTDDGVGLPAGARRVDAMGLIGMRERALHLGGTMGLDSTPGAGTRIRVTLPLGTTPGLA